MKIDVLRQAHRGDWYFTPTRLTNRKSPITIPTISILSLSLATTEQRRRITWQPTEQRVWNKIFLEKTSSFHPRGFILLIDGGRVEMSPIQISNLESWFTSQDLGQLNLQNINRLFHKISVIMVPRFKKTLIIDFHANLVN